MTYREHSAPGALAPWLLCLWEREGAGEAPVRVVAAASAGEALARVALDAGYADQAHFSADCRALAGVPPSVFSKTRTAGAAIMGA